MVDEKKGFEEQESSQALNNDEAVSLIDDIEYKKVDLANLRNRLPVGIFRKGHAIRSFTLHDYTPRFDRELGGALKNSRNKLIPVLANFLPKVIKSFGDYEPKELAKEFNTSVSKLINNMTLADVLTILLATRLKMVGVDDDEEVSCPIAMGAVCPNCQTRNVDDPDKGRPYHELASVEINMIPNLRQKPIYEVQLEDGIKVSDEEVIERVWMNPMKFNDADKVASREEEATDISMLYAMIYSLPDSETYSQVRGQVFSDELYDRLTQRDLQKLRKAMEKMQPGPDMTVSMECYKCGFEWDEGLPWGRPREFLFTPIDTDV